MNREEFMKELEYLLSDIPDEEKADFNYEIKCRVGSITVDGEGFSGLSKERKINNGAAKKMELDCSTGAIEVKFH